MVLGETYLIKIEGIFIFLIKIPSIFILIDIFVDGTEILEFI